MIGFDAGDELRGNAIVTTGQTSDFNLEEVNIFRIDGKSVMYSTCKHLGCVLSSQGIVSLVSAEMRFAD